MQAELADEILACLAGGRRLFHYFRDRYALMLLAWRAGDGVAVRELRASRYGRLLGKRVVRDAVAGDGMVRAADLDAVWPHEPLAYVVSLGRWGAPRTHWKAWMQTTRPGVNLVLQLNFSGRHDGPYRHLVETLARDPFRWFGHPVARERMTMAWVRIDLDLDTDEALVEEVQNDWLREARVVGRALKNGDRRTIASYFPGATEADQDKLRVYVERVLAPHYPVWAEASLAAALQWLRDDIGIGTVWYHTATTGARLKRIRGAHPPRSLYTRLPRQFCFELTEERPAFLLANRGWARRYGRTPQRWFRTRLG